MYPINFFLLHLTNSQKLFYYFILNSVKFVDVPLFPHFPLLNFSLNFKLIISMAINYNVPQKFIDFSLDASERYFSEFNSNSEIMYYSFIIFKTEKKNKLLIMLCLFFLFLKTRKINFLFWIYAISLPFIFLAIFLYIDYLDGYFD
jgi:hypothetical protein